MVWNRRVVVTLLLGIWMILQVSPARADQDAATAPVSVDVAAPPPGATEPALMPTATSTVTPTVQPAVTPTIAPTMQPTVTATQTPSVPATVPPTQIPPIVATATATPPPALVATLDPAITCVVSSDVAMVNPGGSVDYDCSMLFKATGTLEDGETAQLNWSFTATPSEGWSVEARLPGQEWPGTGGAVTLTSQQSIALVSTTIVVEVRVNRITCQPGSPAVQLSGTASLQRLNAASAPVGDPVSSSGTGAITPALAPSIEPDLNFAGSLDFGQVTPAAWGDDVVTTGAITLVASNLASTCGDWSIVLSGSFLQADNGSTIPVGNLSLIAVNGVPLSGGGCALVSGCVVDYIQAGPQSLATNTYVLTLSLNVPAGTLVGSFSSSLSAAIQGD